MNGYPRFHFTGGKGAEVQITYTEALVDEKGKKGNRNQLRGKHVVGVSDLFLPEGGTHCEYQPLWMRSFRFIELSIATARVLEHGRTPAAEGIQSTLMEAEKPVHFFDPNCLPIRIITEGP